MRPAAGSAGGAGKQLRLVCKRFRDWFDQGVTSLELRAEWQPHQVQGKHRPCWPYNVDATEEQEGRGAPSCSSSGHALPPGLTSLTRLIVSATLQSPAAALACLGHSTHLTHLSRFTLSGFSGPNASEAVIEVCRALAAMLAADGGASRLATLPSPTPSLPTPLSATPSSPPHHLSGLTRLDLTFNDMTQPLAAEAFLMGALRSPLLAHLTHLDLTGCYFDEASAALLGQALAVSTHLTNLQVLDISRTDIPFEGATAMAAALLHATHLSCLEQLTLCHNKMLFGELLCLPHVARSLRKLTLEYNYGDGRDEFADDPCSDIDERDAESFFAAFQAVAPLPPCGGGGGCGGGFSNLQELRLWQCNGQSRIVARFLDALLAAMHLTRLTVLSLSSTDVGGEGGQRLAALLRGGSHLSGLRDLCVSYTCIEPALGEVISALAAATHLTDLQVLDFSGLHFTAAPQPGIGPGPALAAPHIAGSFQQLLMRGCPLDDAGAAGMAAALSTANLCRLARVQLTSALGSRAALAVPVVSALLTNTQLTSLERLELSDLGLGLDDQAMPQVTALLPAATHLSRLQALHLGSSGITDGAAEALAGALRDSTQLTGLRELNLRSVYGAAARKVMRRAGAAALCDALTASPHLAALRHIVIDREVAEQVRGVCRRAPHLRHVVVVA